MADQETIKVAFERNKLAVEKRPSIGQGTATTKVTVRNGMTCDIEDGEWTLIADQPQNLGGENAGPDPGVFGRAALASCLAQAYAYWAATLDVPLSKIEVDVHSDYDARGMFDVDGVSPGWTGLRYSVRVESDAPEADVRRLIEHADAHSPLLDDFSKPFDISRELAIAQPGD